MGNYMFEHNGIIWNLDPHNYFIPKEGMKPQIVAQMLGLIPSFIEDNEDVINIALERYGMGGPQMTGGTIEKGVYKYPEDPDLLPLATCFAGGKMVLCYEYGIIAFVDVATSESEVYRFD